MVRRSRFTKHARPRRRRCPSWSNTHSCPSPIVPSTARCWPIINPSSAPYCTARLKRAPTLRMPSECCAEQLAARPTNYFSRSANPHVPLSLSLHRLAFRAIRFAVARFLRFKLLGYSSLHLSFRFHVQPSRNYRVGFQKQPFVALSACEAELIAASEATKEAIYLRPVFNDLGMPSSEPANLFMDNKLAISCLQP
eukprot:3544023-Pleurochrysis_carterae.AAC.1